MQAKLDELAELWAAGTIGRSEWLKARGQIEKRQTLAKKRLAALNRTTAVMPHLGDADGLREKWAGMT